MLLKDKIILVFYADIRYIGNNDISVYLKDIDNKLKYIEDGSVEIVIIPIRETSRVECINPRLATDNENKKIEELIEKYNEYIKN